MLVDEPIRTTIGSGFEIDGCGSEIRICGTIGTWSPPKMDFGVPFGFPSCTNPCSKPTGRIDSLKSPHLGSPFWNEIGRSNLPIPWNRSQKSKHHRCTPKKMPYRFCPARQLLVPFWSANALLGARKIAVQKKTLTRSSSREVRIRVPFFL